MKSGLFGFLTAVSLSGFSAASAGALDSAELIGAPDNPCICLEEMPATPLETVSGGAALKWTKPAWDDPGLRYVLPEARDRIVTAVIPGSGEVAGFGDAAPVQLYDRGRRLPISRWPKTGRLMIAAPGPVWNPHDPTFVRPKTVTVASGEPKERLARWAQEPDLWLWGAWRYGWSDSVERVQRLDVEKGSFEMTTAGVVYGVSKGCTDGGWYQVRNALCDLSEPGEWAIDRKARRLYLVAPDGGPDGVTIALRESALVLTGVRDRVIEGKVYECCRKSAVVLDCCTNVVIRRSIVRNTGACGVEMHNCQNCRVEGCDLYDIGEAGVDILGGGNRDTLASGSNAVINCHIHHYGRVKHNYRPGVYLRYGVGNRVEHCLIHHAKHAGVVFEGNDHYIGWNIIHDVCRDNYDCGAIYTHTLDAWWARGTVIERNLVHHVGKGRGIGHTMAYYIDGWSSGVTVRDNIASGATEGIFQSGGNDNVYVRNIVIDCSKSIVHSNLGLCGGTKPFPSKRPGVSRGRDSDLFRGLERNKALFSGSLWTSRYPNMMRVYEFADARRAHDSLFAVITNNVCAASPEPVFQDRELMEGYQTIGGNVCLDDPGFVDYERLDFELKTDSPARRIVGGGTRFAEMGLFQSPFRVSPPVRFGEGVTAPATDNP